MSVSAILWTVIIMQNQISYSDTIGDLIKGLS